MSVTANFEWTPECVQQLRRLVDEGLSASKIADNLQGASRNAVVGKVHRLGLRLLGQDRTVQPKPKVSANESAAEHNKHQHIVRRIEQRAKAVAKAAPTTAPAPILEATEAVDLPPETIPADQRKTLAELAADTCRWPIGDPMHADFHFCGAGPELNRPYCPAHSRMAYRPPVQRAARHVWRDGQKARAA